MDRKLYPGGLFGEAFPTGEFAISMIGKVQTHLGFIAPLPTDYFMFIRATTKNGFKFAGKDHTGYGGHQWTQAGGWSAFGQPLMGENPVIFNANGQLVTALIPSGGSVSSQGYRYVAPDGSLISADATYFDVAADLSEYSEYGGLKIGMGHNGGGIKVWDPTHDNGPTQPKGARKVLDTGDCRFVIVNGLGEQVTITYVKTGEGVVVINATLTELRALPLDVVAPPPPPAPKPTPTPAPKPTIPPAPQPMPPTPFDPSQVQFVDSPGDMASWPQTATITSVKFDGDRFQVDHTGRDSWPDLPLGDGKGGMVQYTLGICAFVKGHWVGAAVVQFWKGRELTAGGGVSTFASDWFYDGRWADLQGHQPQPGDPVAVFAVAGNDRDSSNPPTGANRQRTDFALITWGQNYNVSAPVPQPTPQPVPVDPNPPAVDLTALFAVIQKLSDRVTALESAPAPAAPTVDLSGYAKKGDKVSVKGHVLVFGVKSNEATWEGTIDK